MAQRLSANSSGFTHARKRNIAVLGLLSFLLATLLIGCGDGQATSKAASPPAPVQACELLKTAEVEALIGAPVSEPRRTHKEHEPPQQWMSMCNYYSEEKQIGIGITVVPHGRNVTGAEAMAVHEAELKKSLGNDYKLEIVEGIGDRAGWEATVKQLTIFQGPFMVIVGIVSPKLASAEALAFSRQISEKILAQLPRQ